MTDTAIIELYFSRSEQAIAESETSYGGYCYRVANGILNDCADSEESVNDTWLAAWNAIPPTRPQIDAFNAFLAGCPAAERNLFVARYWYGLPVEELAARFGLKKNTAVSRLRRTRIRLLKYLEKEDLQ